VDGEDQGVPGWDSGDDSRDDEESERILGWIPPDDRLWRHPSEAGEGPGGVAAGPTVRSLGPTRGRPSPWVMGGTTCVVLALVAAGIMLSTTGSVTQNDVAPAPHVASLASAPTTEPGATGVAAMAAVAAMVASVGRSTVVLSVERPSGTTTGTGTVVESGGIIVTTQNLSGATSISATEASGVRQQATVLGTDKPTGLSVLHISDDLPAATFDDADMSLGTTAVAMALEPGSRADTVPTPVVYAGKVVSVGSAMGLDAVTDAFAVTAVDAPLSGHEVGCPLLDSSGQVAGLLDKSAGTGTSTMGVFLPAELVLGVARQLVDWGTVNHGWLGVETSDAVSTAVTASTSTGTAQPLVGARLDSVDSHSPAAEGDLEPGDVITAIDSSSVHSNTELRTRLYAEPPGETLEVTFERDGVSMTTSVMLADDDPDAPGDDASS
jgi:putative serine protease PepD